MKICVKILNLRWFVNEKIPLVWHANVFLLYASYTNMYIYPTVSSTTLHGFYIRHPQGRLHQIYYVSGSVGVVAYRYRVRD